MVAVFKKKRHRASWNWFLMVITTLQGDIMRVELGFRKGDIKRVEIDYPMVITINKGDIMRAEIVF